MDIRLTPAGHLRWETSGDEATPIGSAPPIGEERVRSIRTAFQADRREALFTLAAEKTPVQDLSGLRYWQQLAGRYLTGLCHIPEEAESFEVEPLTPADCAHWILTAPPMQGGEYLGEDTLQRIWERLDEWVHEAVEAAGGLAALTHRQSHGERRVGVPPLSPGGRRRQPQRLGRLRHPRGRSGRQRRAPPARRRPLQPPRPGNTPPPRPRTSLPPRCRRDVPAMRLQASPGGRRPLPPPHPRKRAAAKVQDLPASTVSAGRARNAASSVSRGTKTPATAAPRKRASARTPADASPTGIRPTGKWVARLRRRCGLTVAQFAARLGVSVVTVYRWEATPGRLNLHTRPLNALTALYRRSGKAAG